MVYDAVNFVYGLFKTTLAPLSKFCWPLISWPMVFGSFMTVAWLLLFFYFWHNWCMDSFFISSTQFVFFFFFMAMTQSHVTRFVV